MSKDEFALFKYSIISSYINGTSMCKSIREYCKLVANNTYIFKGREYRFDAETIRKWIRQYNKDGFDSLIRKPRSDINETRTLSDDVVVKIIDYKERFPKATATAIYKELIEEGFSEVNNNSIRTFQRYIRSKNFLKPEEKERKMFSFENSNDSWQADTTQGPYITIKGIKYKTYIQIIIDDHSRFIVGYKVTYHDSALVFQKLLKNTISIYGVPRILALDNGAPYSNKQLSIICARLGIKNINAKPYDPEFKGKIERFNNTLKSKWMNITDWSIYKSIDDLDKDVGKQIDEYNSTIHSVTKQKPMDLYIKDLKEYKTVDINKLDEYFYHTITRKVNKIGIVTIENNKYETDYSLRGKTLDFTYDPLDLSAIYNDGNKYELLNSVENSKKKRKKNVDFIKAVNMIDGSEKEYEQD